MRQIRLNTRQNPPQRPDGRKGGFFVSSSAAISLATGCRVFTKVLTRESTYFQRRRLQEIRGSITPQVRGGF